MLYRGYSCDKGDKLIWRYCLLKKYDSKHNNEEKELVKKCWDLGKEYYQLIRSTEMIVGPITVFRVKIYGMVQCCKTCGDALAKRKRQSIFDRIK